MLRNKKGNELINSKDLESLLTAIDDLIDIKMMIRQITPSYKFDDVLNDKFLHLLRSLHTKLHPIFLKFLTQEDALTSKDLVKEKVLRMINAGNFALISAERSKKKLKSIGVNPRQIIVMGGPISAEDYKLINPNLPDKALEGIRKKCEHLIYQIKSENWEKKDLYFIYDTDNPTDKLILKKLDDISRLIGKKLKTMELKSWKDLGS